MLPGIETFCKRLRSVAALGNVAVCELACLQDHAVDFEDRENIAETGMKIALVLDQLVFVRNNYDCVIESLTRQNKFLLESIKSPEDDTTEKPEYTKQEENENR